MFEELERYLKVNASLTHDEIEEFRKRSIMKTLRKKHYLLREGEVCKYNCFVAKGCLRLYHVTEDGSPHILRFAVENWWMADYESYNSGKPSKNDIDALEDSKLVMIEKNDMNDLVESIPSFRVFRDRLDARSFDASQNRILSIISDGAEKRYEKFIATYPDFFSRVPLHMIASFLGLTRETLSRVRRQYTKGK